MEHRLLLVQKLIGVSQVNVVTQTGTRDGNKSELVFCPWLHFIQEMKGKRHETRWRRRVELPSFLALNQPCYLVCFFVLFVTCFVHNVAATISYDLKELLVIRTVITYFRLDSFSSMSQTGRIYYRHPTRPRTPSFTEGRNLDFEYKDQVGL